MARLTSDTVTHVLDRFDEFLRVGVVFEIDEFAVELDYHI